MDTPKTPDEIQYCGYFPNRIMKKLNTMATIKIMFYILTKCSMNKNMNAISIRHKDVSSLSKRSFYRGLKDLEDAKWIWVDRSDCHKYEITLIPNYKFTNLEINFLEGRRKK